MREIKKNKSRDAWEYFDDCAVCQAMKEADEKDESLGMEDLESAFAKQNFKNNLKNEKYKNQKSYS